MSIRGGLALLVAAAGLAAAIAIVSSGGPARGRIESLFQDDGHLLYASNATVESTLGILKRLGVDRLRLTIEWRAIAPDPLAATRPAGFDAANPADYSPAAWAPYDRVVELARLRGLGVDFDLTAPGPLWAMGRPAPNAKAADHFEPSARDFGQFVAAVGKRYSGSYVPSGGSSRLPRVSYWSVWNEPNQPGWLAPQSQAAGAVMESPSLYRQYVDEAFAVLRRTGHGPSSDTILIGELAPEGRETAGPLAPIPPMPFLRALYCVDSGYRPLRGTAAAALGCPTGKRSAFAASHPGLFQASGFAHHPYSFFLAPAVAMPDPNFVPLADLPRLEHGLDAAFRVYGVGRRLPLYLTEYGYETNPPNPYRGVSPELQSLYLNEAQYLAGRDTRVRALSQFLLYDADPDPSFRPGTIGYWSTFQTGLLYANGMPKPSFRSYQLPIFLPNPVLSPGRPVFVWGMLRGARGDGSHKAQLQWRPLQGPYRTVATLTTDDPSGVLTAAVHLPGPGAVRITWASPRGVVHYSRDALLGGR